MSRTFEAFGLPLVGVAMHINTILAFTIVVVAQERIHENILLVLLSIDDNLLYAHILGYILYNLAKL